MKEKILYWISIIASFVSISGISFMTIFNYLDSQSQENWEENKTIVFVFIIIMMVLLI